MQCTLGVTLLTGWAQVDGHEELSTSQKWNSTSNKDKVNLGLSIPAGSEASRKSIEIHSSEVSSSLPHSGAHLTWDTTEIPSFKKNNDVKI
jgi:hypothetical protein